MLYFPSSPSGSIVTKFGLPIDFVDVINCFKFHFDRIRGLDFMEGRIVASPIGT